MVLTLLFRPSGILRYSCHAPPPLAVWRQSGIWIHYHTNTTDFQEQHRQLTAQTKVTLLFFIESFENHRLPHGGSCAVGSMRRTEQPPQRGGSAGREGQLVVLQLSFCNVCHFSKLSFENWVEAGEGTRLGVRTTGVPKARSPPLGGVMSEASAHRIIHAPERCAGVCCTVRSEHVVTAVSCRLKTI